MVFSYKNINKLFLISTILSGCYVDNQRNVSNRRVPVNNANMQQVTNVYNNNYINLKDKDYDWQYKNYQGYTINNSKNANNWQEKRYPSYNKEVVKKSHKKEAVYSHIHHDKKPAQITHKPVNTPVKKDDGVLSKIKEDYNYHKNDDNLKVYDTKSSDKSDKKESEFSYNNAINEESPLPSNVPEVVKAPEPVQAPVEAPVEIAPLAPLAPVQAPVEVAPPAPVQAPVEITPPAPVQAPEPVQAPVLIAPPVPAQVPAAVAPPPVPTQTEDLPSSSVVDEDKQSSNHDMSIIFSSLISDRNTRSFNLIEKIRNIILSIKQS